MATEVACGSLTLLSFLGSALELDWFWLAYGGSVGYDGPKHKSRLSQPLVLSYRLRTYVPPIHYQSP